MVKERVRLTDGLSQKYVTVSVPVFGDESGIHFVNVALCLLVNECHLMVMSWGY